MFMNSNKTKITKILLLDDDEDLLFLAKSFLSRQGVDIVTVTSGEAGIDIFKKDKNNFDIIILDHSFKHTALQGSDILVALKEINPDIKVVISSGYPENYFKDNYSEEVYNLASGFISKNYSSPSFLEYLNTIFND